MRLIIVLSFLFFAGWGARGSDVSRYQVERGSELEKELGYKLSLQDHHDEERSLGLDVAVPIVGAAPDYWVEFRATVAGKLKDLFELDRTLTDANGTLIRVPLAIRPIWSKGNEIDVRFPIKKELINQAVLDIRGGGAPIGSRLILHPEASYTIRLGDYGPSSASALPSPTPRSTLIRGPYHVIRLATLEDTGEQVAMLDFKVFKSVEALKEHIEKLPGGSEISFQRWLGPAGGPELDNKFVKATD